MIFPYDYSNLLRNLLNSEHIVHTVRSALLRFGKLMKNTTDPKLKTASQSVNQQITTLTSQIMNQSRKIAGLQKEVYDLIKKVTKKGIPAKIA